MSWEAFADEGCMDTGGHTVADTVKEHKDEEVAGSGKEGKAQRKNSGTDGADQEQFEPADFIGDFAAAGSTDDHGDISCRSEPTGRGHAKLSLHIVGQPGDKTVVAIKIQNH